MLPRPRFRLPLWAAFAIVAAAYVVRSVARGFDFHPDMPTDAVVLAALLVVVAVVAYVRADDARHSAQNPQPDETPAGNAADDTESDEGPSA